MRELEESNYEVVAGARRLRAAKLAALENLPVRIVKLTDAQVSIYDEAELCKLLLEISLLNSAYQRSTTNRADVLMDVAKSH